MQTDLATIRKNPLITGLISTIFGSIKIDLSSGLILCLTLCLLNSSAIIASDKLELKQLMLSLSQVESSKANFSETKSMKLLKKPLILTGQLIYKAPDYLQKKVISPSTNTYTITGQQVKTEEFNKEAREFSLDESVVLQALVESLRATLSGNKDTLEEFYEVSISGQYTSWVLDLEPIDDDIKIYIRSIKITGQETRILSMETIETNNDSSLMVINAVD